MQTTVFHGLFGGGGGGGGGGGVGGRKYLVRYFDPRVELG